MHIAYLVNQYPTISHTFIRREIHELERQGHIIERFSIRDTRDQVIDPLDKEELKHTTCVLRFTECLTATARIAVTRPLRFLKALSFDFALWRNAGGGVIRHLGYLAEACNLFIRLGGRAEHLHAHFGTNSTNVALLCHALGGPPYSFTVHGPEEFDRVATESIALKIANSRFVVAISSFGKAQLQRCCPPWNWRKINVVRCSVDDDFIARAPVPVPNTRQLVCVARLDPQKGLLTLIEALHQLAQSSNVFEMILVGDGQLRPELEHKIASMGLHDRVRLIGAQTGAQVRRWLESSRCFVLPSYAEGLPVVIMEAFALARPVVSTYVAGIPELVSHGQSGWLVPAGAVDELAEAIRQALEMPVDALYQMGLRGRERVLERHSTGKEVKRLAQLFTVTTDDGG